MEDAAMSVNRTYWIKKEVKFKWYALIVVIVGYSIDEEKRMKKYRASRKSTCKTGVVWAFASDTAELEAAGRHANASRRNAVRGCTTEIIEHEIDRKRIEA